MSRLRTLVRKVAARQPMPPGQRLLRSLRQRALEHVLTLYQPGARALEPGLARRDRDAQAALGELASAALVAFRARVIEEAHGHGLASLVVRLDRAWNGPTEPEHMDDPAFPEEERTKIIEVLDRFNESIGSYALFLEALRPALDPSGTTRVLDLASGHGGFPLALSRLARAQQVSLDITATDLKREYLDVGAAIAKREGLTVHFAEQDALDLSNLALDPPDVITCTQAIHHFPPALVARMFDEAARVARRAVVFIDGCRSMLYALPLATFGYGIAHNRGFTHDGVISLRRFFAIEELDLLANIVPRDPRAHARFVRPSHIAVTLDTRR